MSEISYSEALKEAEAIVKRIEENDVPVDELVSQVARATQLIKGCREQLEAAQFEVREVLAELEAK